MQEMVKHLCVSESNFEPHVIINARLLVVIIRYWMRARPEPKYLEASVRIWAGQVESKWLVWRFIARSVLSVWNSKSWSSSHKNVSHVPSRFLIDVVAWGKSGVKKANRYSIPKNDRRPVWSVRVWTFLIAWTQVGAGQILWNSPNWAPSINWCNGN